MKNTITVNEANLFLKEATPFLLKNEGSKLAYAIRQVSEDFNKTEGIVKKHSKEVRKAKVMKASVDEKGNIIVEAKMVEGREYEIYKYTPANLLLLEDEIEALSEKEFSFEPYCATDIRFLTDAQINAFAGIVIPEDYKNPEQAPKMEIAEDSEFEVAESVQEEEK